MAAQDKHEHDIVVTDQGNAEIWFLGHGSLMISMEGLVVHIDPYSAVADYSLLPAADLILVTHHHGDHLDMKAIGKIRRDSTVIFASALAAEKIEGARIMNNGDNMQYRFIDVLAVPAYNIVNERSPGNPYHPRGEGNGYVITIGNTRIYIGGDTEKIPEMARLTDIDIAFLPMNLPYTMTPEMVAEAVAMFNPGILYPYHYGNTDTDLLLPLINKDITEVRIRNLK